ncbi:hypothetical protein [Nitrospirillum sp. BR 11163]|uniref:hypothetical protein n=1 Tax=Nitrospirillum sp. BR 11163 TaxID=3104323 RepID=UPI002AFFAF94|nr:hypothetical protein [Nitrospirillum sp. BR 11163]MEA1674101.1 hypothetical protein [Nitrospirillum sp. BR 11163]
MLSLWQAARPQPGRITGMAAGLIPVIGHLPERGGAAEQAAVMLDAFDVMDAAAAEILGGGE